MLHRSFRLLERYSAICSDYCDVVLGWAGTMNSAEHISTVPLAFCRVSPTSAPARSGAAYDCPGRLSTGRPPLSRPSWFEEGRCSSVSASAALAVATGEAAVRLPAGPGGRRSLEEEA